MRRCARDQGQGRKKELELESSWTFAGLAGTLEHEKSPTDHLVNLWGYWVSMAEATRLELETSAVTEPCSNGFQYISIKKGEQRSE